MKKTKKLLLSFPVTLLIISCGDNSIPQKSIDEAVSLSNKSSVCFAQNFARQFPSVIDQGVNKQGTYTRDVLDSLVSVGFLKSEAKQIKKKQFGKTRTKSVIEYSLTDSGMSEFKKNDAFCFANTAFKVKETDIQGDDVTVEVMVSLELFDWAKKSSVLNDLKPISDIIKKPDWLQRYRFVKRDGKWLSNLACGGLGNVCKE